MPVKPIETLVQRRADLLTHKFREEIGFFAILNLFPEFIGKLNHWEGIDVFHYGAQSFCLRVCYHIGRKTTIWMAGEFDGFHARVPRDETTKLHDGRERKPIAVHAEGAIGLLFDFVDDVGISNAKIPQILVTDTPA